MKALSVALLCVSLILPMGTAARAQSLGGVNPASLDPSVLQAIRQKQASQSSAIDPEPVAPPQPSASGSAGQPIKTPLSNELSLLQQHVKSMTGLTVERFGARFFGDSYSAIPYAGAAVDDYRVGPGDEIRVQLTSPTAEFDDRFVVGRDGKIFLPKVGAVTVAGVQSNELEDRLYAVLSSVFAEFDLYTSLGKLRPIEIYIVGQAARPGKLVVQSPATLVAAVFASGGPSALGSYREVQLIRGNKVVGSLDLYEFILTGRFKEDVRLQHGDRINYTAATNEVAFVGTLPTPLILELPPQAKVKVRPTELLGITAGFQRSEALLERLQSSDDQPLELKTLAVERLDSFPFAGGDVVRFVPISPKFRNDITFKILDAEPIRLPLGTGETISSFLPGRVPILDRDFYLQRNKTSAIREITAAPGQMANSSVGTVDSRSAAIKSNLEEEKRLLERQSLASARLSAFDRLRASLAEFDINWEQALVERLNPATQQVEVLTFNLREAMLSRNPQHDLPLKAGDVVTVLRASEFKSPLANSRKIIKIEGEVQVPGIYQVASGETLEDVIRRAGGLTPNAYLFGLELRRQSVLLDQRRKVADLARSYEIRALADLRGDTSQFDLSSEAAIQARQVLFTQNLQLIKERSSRIASLQPSGRIAFQMSPILPALPRVLLEDQDQIVVPAQPSHIQVAGSVVNEGVLLYSPRMTVRKALLSAGVLDTGDVRLAFVVRADGSVVAPVSGEAKALLVQGSSKSWFSEEEYPVLDTQLMPGDTVVVPDRPIVESGRSRFVRNLKDFTQIFSQFGLGVAALQVLRD